jgi:glucose/arabinose dehydrogenase
LEDIVAFGTIGPVGAQGNQWSKPTTVAVGAGVAAGVVGGGVALSRYAGFPLGRSIAALGAVAGVGLLAAAAVVGNRSSDEHKHPAPVEHPATAVGPGTPADADDPNIGLKKVATGLTEPVQVVAPRGGDDLYVVQKSGQLVRIDGDKPTTVLDISPKVQDSGEMGMLSVAFHPDFAHNGKLYVSYDDRHGDSQIEEYTQKDGKIDPSSARHIISVDQPVTGNHKGGQLQFGPDGYLYLAMGDGGGGGDTEHYGQNMGTLLSKMVRIDVDHHAKGEGYSIPSDNPFVDVPGVRPEIWASGLRNPWRFSFDREEGNLYIADVGQNEYEEVDYLPWDAASGANFGWSVREAAHDYNLDQSTGLGRPVDPVMEYDHSKGNSITGGFVYRGADIPALQGWYLYSDFGDGHLRGFQMDHGSAVNLTQWDAKVNMPSGFGENGHGEMYVASLEGDIYKVVAGEGTGDSPDTPTTPVGTVVTLHVTPDHPMEFDKKELTLPAGEITLRAEVNSATMHNIAIEEIDPNTGQVIPGSERAHGQVVGQGGVSQLTYTLEAGHTYKFSCQLHYGMMDGVIHVQ